MKNDLYDDLIARGEAAFELEEYESALAFFSQATDYKEKAQALYKIALINFYLGNREKADSLYQSIIDKYPNFIDVYLGISLLREQQQNLGAQFYALQELLKLDPHNIKGLNNLANYYRNSGQFELAEKTYLEALSIEPNNPYIKYNYSRLLSMQGKDEQQKSLLLEVATDPPRDLAYSVYYILGYMELYKYNIIQNKSEQKHLLNSIQEYAEKLINLNSIPYFAKKYGSEPIYHGYYLLGQIYHHEEEYLKVINILNYCLESKPNENLDVITHYIGYAYMQLKQYKNAEYFFKKNLEIKSDNYKTLNNLAYCLIKQNKKNKLREVISILNPLIESIPADYIVDLKRSLAIAYCSLKDYQKSISYFEQLIQYEPDVAQNYRALASIYEIEGHLNKAIEYYKKSLVLEPEHLDTKNKISQLTEEL